MSKIKKNLLTQGLSGMLGGMLVFRRVGNETIVSSAPSKGRNSTEEQQEHRSRFKLASQYAKGQMSDPLMKKAYALAVKGRPMVTAFNAAVSDFLVAPQITEIDLSKYTGNTNDVIRIRAVDDFKVVSVSVTITDVGGEIVESGNAVIQLNGLEWLYTSTSSNPNITGDKIIIKVTDLPGNETVQEEAL